MTSRRLSAPAASSSPIFNNSATAMGERVTARRARRPPLSMRLASKISPSRVRSGTFPISFRYKRVGSGELASSDGLSRKRSTSEMSPASASGAFILFTFFSILRIIDLPFAREFLESLEGAPHAQAFHHSFQTLLTFSYREPPRG